jgi:hypothetical protein
LEPKTEVDRVQLRDFASIWPARSKNVMLMTHMGLGDQVSMAGVVDAWADKCEAVFMPVKTRNFKLLSELFAYVPNLVLVEVEASSRLEEIKIASKFAKRHGLELVNKASFADLSRSFPELGVNGRLALMIGGDPGNLRSEGLASHLEQSFAGAIPRRDYAFIDHHPGTRREIPPQKLDAIKKRGLQLVVHDPNTSFLDLHETMKNASELHLVSSAPLCLALTCIAPEANHHFRYRPFDEYPLLLDYDLGWTEESIVNGRSFPVDRFQEHMLATKKIASMGRASRKLRSRLSGLDKNSPVDLP